MDEQEKGNELEGFEVTELDDRDLDDVAGGRAASACINGNCGCPAGSTNTQDCTNGNCSCGGSATEQPIGDTPIGTISS